LKSEEPSFSASSPVSGNSSETDGLPMFAKARWATNFLPTLYLRMASAPNPWQPYNNGSSLLETLQVILDVVYPKSGYIIKVGDRIYSMVRTVLTSL
jgi:hypothetical protein